ncbi:DUF2252 family protein [Sphingomonas sp. NFR15]|uniref:DUF2252 family protein n=1 Tax=Sphingomonas sp. NFR15 TaxID=1566282 RepID=UPI0008889107|nr:DUF2252 family protein [Sphingomonas sp. NFR15]SDA26122.1 hypothetical protein SAMN03159340_01968 [Sphingomonas sp. NFR15]
MSDIHDSVRGYEGWLREQLGYEVVEKDLVRKRAKMAKTAFVFLRATYWRWAETILSIRPDLADAAPVLAIGDTHLENFGTWRDGEGRLVWGANDFDDAAVMPWPLDIVRLAASALLAGGESAEDICDAVWDGYRAGLAKPRPLILEREHRWLRREIMLPETERTEWWRKLAPGAKARAAGAAAPARFHAALAAAFAQVTPDAGEALPIFARTAGTGSLGKPRYAAQITWLGGPVVREVKAILPPAWAAFGPGTDATIRAGTIAHAETRAVDPHYRVDAGLVVRRLSPNSRKIEASDAGAVLMSAEMLRLMGREIATCHAGDLARLAAVRADAARRDADWLRDHARAAAKAVKRDFKAFA